jgi:hypothetical protein
MAATGQITGVSDGQVILCVSDAFSLLLAEGSEEHHRVPEASWRSGLFFASCTTAPSPHIVGYLPSPTRTRDLGIETSTSGNGRSLSSQSRCVVHPRVPLSHAESLPSACKTD